MFFVKSVEGFTDKIAMKYMVIKLIKKNMNQNKILKKSWNNIVWQTTY